jgi:hypothetical protein
MAHDGGLGRRVPTDFTHVEKYPLRAAIQDPLDELVVPPKPAEVGLGLPPYWKTWDQGNEGACVGFGGSVMMGVTNSRQYWRLHKVTQQFRYDPWWLYNEAQLVDEWAETPPEEGTSVNAACKILKAKGHCRVYRSVINPVNVDEGISAYRWATTVDEMRAAIFAQRAIAIGVNWYDAFDSMGIREYNGELWIGIDSSGKPKSNLGSIRGGHCVGIYRMSDRRQAFRFMNSWGDFYPPMWLPYAVMQRLLDEYGEAAVITDR